MKLAYSTYALQPFDIFEVVHRVKEIGYEALELNVGDDWPTAPSKLDGDARSRIAEAYEKVGFPSPVLMNLIHLCAEGEDVEAKSVAFGETCQLARDLCFDDRTPVVTSTLGGQKAGWDEVKSDVADRLVRYASIADDHGVTIAVEAHVGQELDSPEKAVWLVEAVDRPSVRLNFDHSHFHVLEMELQHCLDLCAPYSVHTHIKDGAMVDGKVQFALPGEGSLDLVEYLTAIEASVLDVPITVEVSAQFWKAEGFQAWEVAERCFRHLSAARNALPESP
jgi:inosose dehydratase